MKRVHGIVGPSVSTLVARAGVLALCVSAAACTIGPDGRINIIPGLTGGNTSGYQNPQPTAQPGYVPPAGQGGPTGLAGADQLLRSQGYQPLGAPAGQNLTQGQLIAFPIMAQPGACYVAIAVGGAGVRDVDMEVVGPSGNSIAEDRETDAHPTVHFCPQEPGMHFARVSMYGGSGGVEFISYQGPMGGPPNLASAWRVQPGPAQGAAPSGPIDPATMARIDAVRSTLSAAGYQQVREPSAVAVATGQTAELPASLQGGWCYAFATFGGPGVRDSDIFLNDGSRDIVSDTATSVDSIVRDVCLPQSGNYRIRPRLYSGSGPVYLLAMARSNGATGPVTQTAIAMQGGDPNAGAGMTQPPPARTALDARFNRFSRSILSLGYETVGEPVSHSMGTGEENVQPVTLTAGSCYAIGAQGDASVQNLALYLMDAQNREVDRDYSASPRPVVRVCPGTTGQYNVRMVMTGGQGGFRMGLFRWGGATSGAGLTGLTFVRNSEMTRLLSADGYQGDANFDIYTGRIREGATVNRNITLEQGACYAVVAVGGDGVADLNLALQSGGRQVAVDTQPTAFPVVRYCATQAGAHRAVISAAHGSGSFVFRVFRRNAGGGRAN